MLCKVFGIPNVFLKKNRRKLISYDEVSVSIVGFLVNPSLRPSSKAPTTTLIKEKYENREWNWCKPPDKSKIK